MGDIARKDVVEASIVREKDERYSSILGFNVKILPEAKEEIKVQGINVFLENVIYKLVENYTEYLKNLEEKFRKETLETITLPGEIEILKGFVFRRSKPAIVGISVLKGEIRPGYALMNKNGKRIGRIRQIQSEGKPIEKAERNSKVAISIEGPTVGRQIKEGDRLFTDIPEYQIEMLEEKFKRFLSDEQVSLLETIKEIKRTR